jgi:putative protein-disulfide isomerase
MATESRLYYIHDPMCSWCYAFRPVWMQIQRNLPADVQVQYVLGGLAPDSDQPMSPEIRAYVQGQWHKIIQTVPGTVFNFAFWEQCQPRRSTYPACRAVLVAREQGRDCEIAMIHAIQDAYYRHAQNPSDTDTLCALAQSVGLEEESFARKLNADTTQQALLADIALARRIGGNSFPSLFLQREGKIRRIAHDYGDAERVLGVL